MDNSVEKVVLEEVTNNFSIFSLFFDADVIVKIVILMLIFASVWSWTIIFSKFSSLNSLFKDSNDFEENFYSSDTLQKLSKKLGSHPTHPLESIFFSAMSYIDKIKLTTSNKNYEFKKNLCERIEKEMVIVRRDKELANRILGALQP